MSRSDFMKVQDKLQLIDVELIGEIGALDADSGWEFATRHLDTLSGMKNFKSGFMYGATHGFEHLKKVFYRFWNDDSEEVRQCLIYDLAFIDEPIRLHPYARAGYLDHPSSQNIKTSDDIIPYCNWEYDRDDQNPRFDVLDADHVNLMSKELMKNTNQLDEEHRLDFLKLDWMEKTIRANDHLRAAYIYDIR